ncbi:MAG: thioredoxin fold domain-containing protein [Thiobacillus sp.]
MRLNMKQLMTSILMLSLWLGLTGGGAALAASDKQKSRLEIALAAAPKATWIAQGQGRRELYVFFDPNCGYCPMIYKNLQPLIAPYGLQLRWIPVAMLDATSLGKAAAILQAKDPKAALDYNEAHYNAEAHTGSISEEIPSAVTETRLRANGALLNQVGIPVVPTILFRAKTGEAMVIQGALSPVALRKVLDRVR